MDGLYREVARVLKRLEGKQGSLKSLVFASERTCSRKKKLYALASQTIKYKSLIIKAMDDCKILEKEPQLSLHLCMVLVYDVLFGKGVQCGGILKQAIHRHKKELKAVLPRLDLAQCIHKTEVLLPKYARVNCLKLTAKEAICKLATEGYSMVERTEFIQMYRTCIGEQHHTVSGDCQSESTLECRICTHKSFCRDSVIYNLFMFCPFAPLTTSSLYSNSQLILQDKASCLPAYLLSPKQDSQVIDTCAAPGNKTSHLACILNNTGTVHAFDKDRQRFKTLREMMAKSGSTCVIPHLKDFLQVNPVEYPEVKFILVDPSCSGSGIVNRVEYSSEVGVLDKQRLNSLSGFQKRILKHALGFPNVQRVVYSTCSIHFEENEQVVENALYSFQTEYDLVHALPEWKRRGDPSFTKGNCCIRTSTDDLTNGFFVAVFERKDKQPATKVDSDSCADPTCNSECSSPKRPSSMLHESKMLDAKQVKRRKTKRKTRCYPVTGR